MPDRAHPVIRHGVASRVAALVAAGAIAILATGCSTTSDSGAADEVVNESYVDAQIIIDVRTPEEFAAGHLEGALLINIKDASFEQQLAALDVSADYVVYCRSGNRSAQAIERMKAVGFTTLTDLGSLQNASDETGVAIVQG